MMESFGQWLQVTPLWVIFTLLCTGLVASALIGWLFRRRHAARAAEDANEGMTDQEGYIVSAVMGLLALLVGFTFALAIDRYDTRRARVLDEANAIGTTYLRAQLLEEPHRRRISGLLVQYTDNRVALGEEQPGPQQDRLLAENDRLIADLWTATVAAFPSMRPYAFSNSFLGTMNQMIDMDSARQAARRAHVPPQVFTLLFFYQLIAAGVLGYVLVGRRGRKMAVFLLLLFALALTLVIDIDRPATGTIRESQEPMVRFQASLRAQPPEIFDRFNAP
jgi:hypothetical protein